MKYANYDKTTGKILGWYNQSIHSEIPTPNIEIEDEVWQNAINNNHNKINKDGTTELFDFRTQEEIDAENVLLVKQAIAQQLATLTVTTTQEHVFDAYTQARQDMADAILASVTLGITETVWRLADNSEVTVSLDELKEAHALAIQAYTKIKGIGA